MSIANCRVGDLWSGVCLADPSGHPGTWGGVITTGSDKSQCENSGQARIGDIVVSLCGHAGVITTGSDTVKSDGQGKARVGSLVTGDILGTIISGASTSKSG